MNFFWKAFDTQLLSFFKPQKIIIWVFSIFLVVTILYSIINFIIIRKMINQTTNLVLILYEVKKNDVAAYLQRIQKFQTLMGQAAGSIRPTGDEQLEFSSEDDLSPKFDKMIHLKSKELREKQDYKQQVICTIIRLAEQEKINREFP